MVEVRPRSSGEGPPYVVVRLDREPVAAAGHDHVFAVETRDPDGGSTRWRASDVIAAIRAGERFVLEGEREGDAALEPALCPVCPRVTVKAVGP